MACTKTTAHSLEVSLVYAYGRFTAVHTIAIGVPGSGLQIMEQSSLFVIYVVMAVLVFWVTLIKGARTEANWARVILGSLLIAALWPPGLIFHFCFMAYLMISDRA